jgi:hypothetical protein
MDRGCARFGLLLQLGLERTPLSDGKRSLTRFEDKKHVFGRLGFRAKGEDFSFLFKFHDNGIIHFYF